MTGGSSFRREFAVGSLYAGSTTSGRSRLAGPLPTSSALSPSEGTVAERNRSRQRCPHGAPAERHLAAATNADTENLQAEVIRCRDEFQRLSAEHMIEWMGKLHEAEGRRSHATPSTLPFHVAARDTPHDPGRPSDAALSLPGCPALTQAEVPVCGQPHEKGGPSGWWGTRSQHTCKRSTT